MTRTDSPFAAPLPPRPITVATMTERTDRDHANFILNRRWPDAQIGEEHGYRPLMGEWNSPTDWIRTESGWEPVTYIKTSQRVRVIGGDL